VLPEELEQFVCAPVVDGELLPEHPLKLIAEGSAKHLRLIIGSNREALSYVPDVYEGGRAFESVNDPRTYDVGLPPFTMHGVKLRAASESEIMAMLDVDGDGILSDQEIKEAKRGRVGKNPSKAAGYARKFNAERAEQMRHEMRFELRGMQGVLSDAAWETMITDVLKAYKRQMANETEQEIWNLIKSDMLMAQVYMVATRWARHNSHVWCYRFDGCEQKLAYHGWDVAPTFGNPMLDMFPGWTTKMFEAGVDVDDSGFTAHYEPSRADMFNKLHEDIRSCWTEFVGAADRLGGMPGNPGWTPFANLGDPHMRFNFPESQESSTTEEQMSRAMRARRAKRIKEKAKYGKFLEAELSSDEEFKEMVIETTGIEEMTTLMEDRCSAMIGAVAW